MKKILVLGGVSYNLMIDVEEFPSPTPQTIHARQFHEAIGSTGAGKSLALKRLGVDVKVHGVIGEDTYGEKIKQCFRNEDIPFFYEIDPNGTERHVNLMKNHTGERISIFLQAPSESIELDKAKIDRLIQDSDIILLNIAPYCRRFIPMIQQHEKETWCDLHSYDGKSEYYDDFINQADVVFLSSERNPDYKDFMESFMESGKKMVVCTHGSHGLTALLPERKWVEVPALHYEVVDTNGAGDNFVAGFLYGYLIGESVEASLRLGTITAGMCVTSRELIATDLSVQKVESEYAKWFGVS